MSRSSIPAQAVRVVNEMKATGEQPIAIGELKRRCRVAQHRESHRRELLAALGVLEAAAARFRAAFVADEKEEGR